MKILIIGGTRFMGPVIVRRLFENGHSITVFHRGQTSAELPEGVREIHGDRNNLDEFADEFRKLKPEVVLDMMLLTEAQANQLMAAMAGVAKRLVVASSCDVYFNFGLMIGTESGTPDAGKISEKARLRENRYPYRSKVKSKDDLMYSYDKIIVERIVLSSQDLPAAVLRLPMVYGPRDHQHRFYDYIRRMADKRSAIILEEKQPDWLMTRGYSENCAEAICRAVEDENSAGHIYNVGDPDALPEREWISRLAKILDWKGKIITLPNDKLPKHLQSDTNWQYSLDIDTSQIRNELGFKEIIIRDRALEMTVEWELAHPPQIDDLDAQYKAEDEALESL